MIFKTRKRKIVIPSLLATLFALTRFGFTRQTEAGKGSYTGENFDAALFVRPAETGRHAETGKNIAPLSCRFALGEIITLTDDITDEPLPENPEFFASAPVSKMPIVYPEGGFDLRDFVIEI